MQSTLQADPRKAVDPLIMVSRLCDHAQPHPVHFNAEPLQPPSPRGGARDDAFAQGTYIHSPFPCLDYFTTVQT
jgi:hypothetical protein